MQTAVMNFVPLSDNAARQVIDSTTVFTEHQRVKAAARPYAGTMYWKKKEGNYEYLVKTQPRRRSQLRMAARSEETERIFSERLAEFFRVKGRRFFTPSRRAFQGRGCVGRRVVEAKTWEFLFFA